MADQSEITRIDILPTPDGYLVSKFVNLGEEWQPVKVAPMPAEFDLEKALEWCRDNGWIIRRWVSYEGKPAARAFKETLVPVRGLRRIQAIRDDLVNRKRMGDQSLAPVPVHTLDLRYEW